MRHVSNGSVIIILYFVLLLHSVLSFIEREIELLQFEEVAGRFFI